MRLHDILASLTPPIIAGAYRKLGQGLRRRQGSASLYWQQLSEKNQEQIAKYGLENYEFTVGRNSI